MTVVTPDTRTTLLVNRNYQAFNFCTARAALRHLMADRAKGLDADGNAVSWTGADLNLAGHSVLRWYNNEVSLYDNHPCLRSAPDRETGEEKKWAVPTILVCNHSFGIHRKTGENVSLRSIFNAYKGICQYCYTKVSMSNATKDHVFPKSKGGTNHDFNIVLACRDCNSAKDNHYPYYDINGKEVKPIKFSNFENMLRTMPELRDEWKPFLHLN